MNISMIARRVHTSWLRNALAITALLLIGAAVALSLASRPATTGAPAASISTPAASGNGRLATVKERQAELHDMMFAPVSTPVASCSARLATVKERQAELHDMMFAPVSTPAASGRSARGY